MRVMKENQIVVYQPNETVRLEVRMENETVWLTQSQMAELFDCTVRNVRLHLANIYECGELDAGSTRKDFFLVRMEGSRKVSAFHDRLLILDENEIYLIGASFKDLGKKCFAFAKLDAANIVAILAKIKQPDSVE